MPGVMDAELVCVFATAALQRERVIGGVKRRRLLRPRLGGRATLGERTLERLLDGGDLHHREGLSNWEKLRVTRRRAHGRGMPARADGG